MHLGGVHERWRDEDHDRLWAGLGLVLNDGLEVEPEVQASCYMQYINDTLRLTLCQATWKSTDLGPGMIRSIR